MNTTKILANRLLRLRSTSGLSQSEFADALGVSRGSISYYENGERTPDVEFLVKVREHFQVDYKYLLGESEIKSDNSRIAFEQSMEQLPAPIRACIMEIHKRMLACAEEYETHDYFEHMAKDLCNQIDAYKDIPADVTHNGATIAVKRFLEKIPPAHYIEVIGKICEDEAN